MSKKSGIKLPVSFAAFDRRVIVFDKSGVPWVIDPERGMISLAVLNIPDDDKPGKGKPRSAVKKGKR